MRYFGYRMQPAPGPRFQGNIATPIRSGYIGSIRFTVVGSNMIWEGINLMFIGMGTVFVFLILLVFCTQMMSRLIARYFPDAVIPATPPVPVTATPDPAQSNEMLAAVTAAVHHHRKRH